MQLAPLAQRITAIRRLHLDDIRPELPKNACTEGPCDQGTEFKHLHTLHGFHMFFLHVAIAVRIRTLPMLNLVTPPIAALKHEAQLPIFDFNALRRCL
jgi:hypothetical protein